MVHQSRVFFERRVKSSCYPHPPINLLIQLQVGKEINKTKKKKKTYKQINISFVMNKIHLFK